MGPTIDKWLPRGRMPRARMALRIVAMAFVVHFAVVVLLIVAYRFVSPPVSALMVWRLLGGQGVDYRWVSLDDISPALPAAVIASEDARFCSHHGVDWTALGQVVDAIADNPDDSPRGASTIAMQTVKNLFLWPWRSYVRKVLEIPLAHLADFVWPKRRMIEIYLNVAEWGPGLYGAEAAAQAHFGRPASKLTRQQAALLAAVLPNPWGREAGRPGSLTRRIANRVRVRMRSIGPHISCIEPG